MDVPFCHKCMFCDVFCVETQIDCGFPCCLCEGLFDTDRSYFVEKVD